ncbi:hypothetical protein [Streptomyces sp. NBC_01264]|uniref:hypothetical protein n=1 Tax=Streptomyces sp. NBC_01264 TaxID=2903804 RepID=UPI0022541A64|nr:hypothetical protein [Streptomyces sp. NBC_01264]MCX4775355.1 hypothetical protein [Streptomyces sp. NBC_01264]
MENVTEDQIPQESLEGAADDFNHLASSGFHSGICSVCLQTRKFTFTTKCHFDACYLCLATWAFYTPRRPGMEVPCPNCRKGLFYDSDAPSLPVQESLTVGDLEQIAQTHSHHDGSDFDDSGEGYIGGNN